MTNEEVVAMIAAATRIAERAGFEVADGSYIRISHDEDCPVVADQKVGEIGKIVGRAREVLAGSQARCRCDPEIELDVVDSMGRGFVVGTRPDGTGFGYDIVVRPEEALH